MGCLERHTPWHKIYSVLNVFLNAISFPLCTAMNNRWNRYCISKGSSVTSVIFLPSSATNSDASEFHGSAVSIAIEMKWCVVARLLYFAILFVAAFFAAALAVSAVSPKWDAAYVSGTVMSHAKGLSTFPGNKWCSVGPLSIGSWELFGGWNVSSLHYSPHKVVKLRMSDVSRTTLSTW